MSKELLDAAVFLPKKHCFWKHCKWTGHNNVELWKHIWDQHRSAELEAAVAYYDARLPQSQRLHTVLNQVASVLTRQGPPLCSAAQDRRSLYNLYQALEPVDSVQSLICFSCGCSHACVQPLAGSRIRYYPCFPRTGLFLGLQETTVEQIFGMKTYLERYGERSYRGCRTSLRQPPFKQELEAWEVHVYLGPKQARFKCLLGCGQDRRCKEHKRASNAMCSQCEVPICHICHDYLLGPKPPSQPPIALSNDMWTGFSARMIYDEKVTYLELLASEPFCLGLVCFIIQNQEEINQQRQGSKDAAAPLPKQSRSLFMQPALQQSARVAVRGNITLFAMPIAEVLQMLVEYDAKPCDLPRTGPELQEVVRILVKGGGDSIKNVIVQATMRRAVVVKLIEDGVRRGHPNYTRVDLDRVRAKAARPVEEGGLPVEGPLPDLLTVGAPDNGLDEVLQQKASSPHPVSSTAEDVFSCLRPNVVLQEKSGNAERDLLSTEVAAWETLSGHTAGDKCVVTTSSHMENTFVYDLLCKAYPFLHKSALAYPDFGREKTFRALQKGPLVNLQLFTACMNRRIEHQFRF